MINKGWLRVLREIVIKDDYVLIISDQNRGDSAYPVVRMGLFYTHTHVLAMLSIHVYVNDVISPWIEPVQT